MQTVVGGALPPVVSHPWAEADDKGRGGTDETPDWLRRMSVRLIVTSFPHCSDVTERRQPKPAQIVLRSMLNVLVACKSTSHADPLYGTFTSM